MGKKLFWTSAAVVGGLAVVSNAMLHMVLKRKPQQPEEKVPGNWFDEIAQPVTRTAPGGLELFGWFVPHPNSRRYAIICHGYRCTARGMRHRAEVFYNMGFNILLPEARAHGKSEGEWIGMGWPERRDIVDWIYDILKKDMEAEILLYGESMGAATVMMTAGEVLPENVKLVIEDCGYSDVMDEMNFSIKKKYKLPAFPIVPAASLFSRLRLGYSFRRASAVNQIQRCRIPVLFMHAEKDEVVPFNMIYKLYSAARCEKKMVTFPEAGHCQCAETDPELYWGSIRDFIAKYMDT